MKRDKLIKNYIKEERGAAMIVVLCVMAIVLALCLSILLAVYQMMASVNDEARDDVYYHQALSASIALQNRLEKESQAMPTSISSIEDYIFYFMANNDTYPTPYEVTFEQEG
ncbi:MAG: hypothetical protein K6F99_05915, partial [Lachnospiraceae bacterium]|nr:hypothetical protein [Lachnospiraceae bacterium]